MSAISWLWQSDLKGVTNVYNGNDPSAPDPASVAQAAIDARAERDKARTTVAGEARERDLMDQRAARQAELTSLQLPAGEVIRRYPEAARWMAEHPAEVGIQLVAAFGPGDGDLEAREMRRLRDEGISKAIRAGDLPAGYVEATGAVAEVW